MPGAPFRQSPPMMQNVSREEFAALNVRNRQEVNSADLVFLRIEGVTLPSGSATLTLPDFLDTSTVGYQILKRGTMNGSRQITVTSAVAGSEVVDILVYGKAHLLMGA